MSAEDRVFQISVRVATGSFIEQNHALLLLAIYPAKTFRQLHEQLLAARAKANGRLHRPTVAVRSESFAPTPALLLLGTDPLFRE
jgi:hypothetical protein